MKILKIAFLLICNKLACQNVEFVESKVNYKFSFETLKVKNDVNLGFVGISADLFIFEKAPNLYTTIGSYSAISGNRPGLITLGMGLGYLKKIQKTPFSIDAGIFIGGGGGGGAPDGGGLITRGNINLMYTFKKTTVFAGYSRLDFPTGDLKGNNINLGVTFNSLFHFGYETKEKEVKLFSPKMTQSKNRFTILGMRYIKHRKGPFELPNNTKPKNIQLIGLQFDRFITNNIYGTLKVNGAVTGGIDGYMNLLIGLGIEQNLIQNKVFLDGQFLAGPSGGGGVDTGGGGTLQGSVGIRTNIGKDCQFKLAYGQSFAPEGNFKSDFIEIGLSKKFDFIYPKNTEAQIYTTTKTDRVNKFGFEIINRTYFAPKKLDKNNKLYDKYFNLIGFKFTKNLKYNFDIIGSTFWAYQGSYGAYAEGWLGLQYSLPVKEFFRITPEISFGTAGGGGIDLGSGLVYQYTLGITKDINKRFGISVNAGKMAGIKGNFSPTLLDLNLRYNFIQITKKKTNRNQNQS